MDTYYNRIRLMLKKTGAITPTNWILRGLLLYLILKALISIS